MIPFAHQSKFAALAQAKAPRFRFLWAAEPGCGKTIGVFLVIDADRIKTAVVAPKSVVESAWVGDARHFPNLRVVVLKSDQSHHQRLSLIAGEWDILATNPEMFRKYGSELIAAGVRRLVFDESSKLKGWATAISLATIRFSDKMDSVILLSGTPAPNGFEEYWAQVRSIVGPQCRPPYQWCGAYGYPVREKVRTKGGTRNVISRWVQSPAQADLFAAKMRNISWALSKKECLDLPPQLDRVIDVRLSPEEIDAYLHAREDLVLRFRDRSVRINGAAALGKLRQIVGGAVYAEGGTERIAESPAKIDALNDWLDELGAKPCLIWFEYRHERNRIAQLLDERKEEYRVIDGETSGEAGATAADFQAGKFRRLVLHPQAAGHGITLHHASHAAYYGLNFSYELFDQSRARIHRAGMGDAPATYTVFRATLGDGDAGRTVDHAMLSTVKRKGAASAGILDALRDAGVPDDPVPSSPDRLAFDPQAGRLQEEGL